MDKYRKKKAAEARRRKARNTRIAGTVIGIAACALITFAGVRFINARMDNASAQQYQAVLPTQLPQGTLAPVHTDYINATPAPTAAALSADELNAGDGWMLLLVNSSNAIPDGYAPTELTELSNGALEGCYYVSRPGFNLPEAAAYGEVYQKEYNVINKMNIYNLHNENN